MGKLWVLENIFLLAAEWDVGKPFQSSASSTHSFYLQSKRVFSPLQRLLPATIQDQELKLSEYMVGVRRKEEMR